MANIECFEEIDAWKKARIFCDIIYKVIFSSDLEKDFALRDQINKSSGSIMDNIAEGFERGGNKEFIQFLSIAKASNAEFRSQLYRVLDRNYIIEVKFNEILNESKDIGKMIGGLIKYLKQSDFKGHKYK